MEAVASVLGLLIPDAPAPPAHAPNVRDRRRARDWHDAVERLTAYRLEHAQHQADRDQVQREHEDELDRGPAFAKTRRRSHDDTPAAARDRNDLVRILALFSQLEIEVHRRDRAWARHEGRRIKRTIARTVRPVLAALVGLAKTHVYVFPSLERLAAMAGCCPRTVTAALTTLERIGAVARVRRRKTIVTPYGRRQVQDSNCYILTMPAETAAQIAARLDRGDAPPPAPRQTPRDQTANLAELFHDKWEVGFPSWGQPMPPRPNGRDWRERERLAMAQRARWGLR